MLIKNFIKNNSKEFNLINKVKSEALPKNAPSKNLYIFIFLFNKMPTINNIVKSIK